jgi:hypothetical protein
VVVVPRSAVVDDQMFALWGHPISLGPL